MIDYNQFKRFPTHLEQTNFDEVIKIQPMRKRNSVYRKWPNKKMGNKFIGCYCFRTERRCR